jgi:magnesium chelatase family protein
MDARPHTVAVEAIEAQAALSPGVASSSIIGLPRKAMTEARERVRAALTSLSIALTAKRGTVNLSPADMPKEGSYSIFPSRWPFSQRLA